MEGFDWVHAESRCGKVKCWGRSSKNWLIGDSPNLYVALEPDERRELGAIRVLLDLLGCRPEQVEEGEDLTRRGKPSDLADYQVKMGEGFLVVRGKAWVEWTDDQVDSLPVVDSFGSDLETTERKVSPGETFPKSGCSSCSPPAAGRGMIEEFKVAGLRWLRGVRRTSWMAVPLLPTALAIVLMGTSPSQEYWAALLTLTTALGGLVVLVGTFTFERQPEKTRLAARILTLHRWFMGSAALGCVFVLVTVLLALRGLTAATQPDWFATVREWLNLEEVSGLSGRVSVLALLGALYSVLFVGFTFLRILRPQELCNCALSAVKPRGGDGSDEKNGERLEAAKVVFDGLLDVVDGKLGRQEFENLQILLETMSEVAIQAATARAQNPFEAPDKIQHIYGRYPDRKSLGSASLRALGQLAMATQFPELSRQAVRELSKSARVLLDLPDPARSHLEILYQVVVDLGGAFGLVPGGSGGGSSNCDSVKPPQEYTQLVMEVVLAMMQTASLSWSSSSRSAPLTGFMESDGRLDLPSVCVSAGWRANLPELIHRIVASSAEEDVQLASIVQLLEARLTASLHELTASLHEPEDVPAKTALADFYNIDWTRGLKRDALLRSISNTFEAAMVNLPSKEVSVESLSLLRANLSDGPLDQETNRGMRSAPLVALLGVAGNLVGSDSAEAMLASGFPLEQLPTRIEKFAKGLKIVVRERRDDVVREDERDAATIDKWCEIALERAINRLREANLECAQSRIVWSHSVACCMVLALGAYLEEPECAAFLRLAGDSAHLLSETERSCPEIVDDFFEKAQGVVRSVLYVQHEGSESNGWDGSGSVSSLGSNVQEPEESAMPEFVAQRSYEYGTFTALLRLFRFSSAPGASGAEQLSDLSTAVLEGSVATFRSSGPGSWKAINRDRAEVLRKGFDENWLPESASRHIARGLGKARSANPGWFLLAVTAMGALVRSGVESSEHDRSELLNGFVLEVQRTRKIESELGAKLLRELHGLGTPDADDAQRGLTLLLLRGAAESRSGSTLGTLLLREARGTGSASSMRSWEDWLRGDPVQIAELCVASGLLTPELRRRLRTGIIESIVDNLRDSPRYVASVPLNPELRRRLRTEIIESLVDNLRDSSRYAALESLSIVGLASEFLSKGIRMEYNLGAELLCGLLSRRSAEAKEMQSKVSIALLSQAVQVGNGVLLRNALIEKVRSERLMGRAVDLDNLLLGDVVELARLCCSSGVLDPSLVERLRRELDGLLQKTRDDDDARAARESLTPVNLSEALVAAGVVLDFDLGAKLLNELSVDRSTGARPAQEQLVVALLSQADKKASRMRLLSALKGRESREKKRVGWDSWFIGDAVLLARQCVASGLLNLRLVERLRRELDGRLQDTPDDDDARAARESLNSVELAGALVGDEVVVDRKLGNKLLSELAGVADSESVQDELRKAIKRNSQHPRRSFSRRV